MHNFIFCFEVCDQLDIFTDGPDGQVPDLDPFVDTCCDKACLRNKSYMRDLLGMIDTGYDMTLAEIVLSFEWDQLIATCDAKLLTIRTPGHIKPLIWSQIDTFGRNFVIFYKLLLILCNFCDFKHAIAPCCRQVLEMGVYRRVPYTTFMSTLDIACDFLGFRV